jgi:hypothetical protein
MVLPTVISKVTARSLWILPSLKRIEYNPEEPKTNFSVLFVWRVPLVYGPLMQWGL